MYDKRELLCNLQVLHAPWVIGNFTVRLCRTKSTGLPLPNFFLGKEQMGRSISAGLLKKPGRGCSPLQHSRISIGYWVFQTITGLFGHILSPASGLHVWLSPLFPCTQSRAGHSKPHRHPSCDNLGLSAKTQLACCKDQSWARPAVPAAPSHFQVHHPMQTILTSHSLHSFYTISISHSKHCIALHSIH